MPFGVFRNDQRYFGYVLKGKKIYIDYQDGSDDYNIRPNVISMKLNGSGKKHSSVRPMMKTKTSNKKGYSVIIQQKGAYAKALVDSRNCLFLLLMLTLLSENKVPSDE